MPTPPSEKGIVSAMNSMKSIAGENSHKRGQDSMPISFPRPPLDFVGTMGSTSKTKPGSRKKTVSKAPNSKKTTGATKRSKTSTSSKTPLPPPPLPTPTTPPLPLPPTKSDTNAQLFGTLVNSLKTCKASEVQSAGGREPAPTSSGGRKSKSKGNKKKKKGYASSSASSSSSSAVSSVSTTSSNSSNASSGSSQSSSPGRTVLSVSSEASSADENSRSVKMSRERKKRREELLHEKVEMLTRIVNLSKNGFTATKEWDVKDDIDEIRYECYRMQRESNSKKSIKIMRRVLVTITTLVETGNSYFNPFNLRLGGFSESMMLNLDDYDDCFEQIHHKYSGRSSVGPEMQILFTFMSAAIFHHAGNTIGGSGGGRDSHAKKKSSASPMSSVMSMMGMLGGQKSSSGVSNYPIPRSTPPPTHRPAHGGKDLPGGDKPKRKTMRGPGASAIPASIFGSTNTTTPSMTLPSEG